MLILLVLLINRKNEDKSFEAFTYLYKILPPALRR